MLINDVGGVLESAVFGVRPFLSWGKLLAVRWCWRPGAEAHALSRSRRRSRPSWRRLQTSAPAYYHSERACPATTP